jgi:hypothetical protein
VEDTCSGSFCRYLSLKGRLVHNVPQRYSRDSSCFDDMDRAWVVVRGMHVVERYLQFEIRELGRERS